MGRKLDKLFADMQAELEDKPETTATEPEQTLEETAPSEETPEEPAVDTEERNSSESHSTEETTEETPSPEDEPEEKPADRTRDIPDDPVKRAEYGFRRQLNKQKEKHAKELEERDRKYEELEKKFAELEKKMTPPEKDKTREDFPDDEDFIDYKVERKFNAKMAERDAELAKAEQERAEKEREAEAARAELQEKQEAWLSNVDQAFGGDRDRSAKFLSQVAYANKNGLGEILDSCPVAADYLINDPMGPVVFEHLLTDRPTFERVFDPRRPNPLAVYRELRNVEDELVKAGKEAQQQPETKPVHLGKPGRQAGGMSTTNIDMFSDPRAVKKWLREQRHQYK